MESEERIRIMEKRSSLRSWQERKGKIPHDLKLITTIIFIVLIISVIGFLFRENLTNSSSNTQLEENSLLSESNLTNISSASQQNKMPSPTSAKKSSSSVGLPAPRIKINSPENITYLTSEPPLDMVVSGTNISKILLSIDDGANVLIPHNGTFLQLDFAMGNPLFIDDFTGGTKGRWQESGKWRLEGGKYITGGGIASFGYTDWDNYIIETKMRITSGAAINVDNRWDGKKSYYRIQTGNGYGNLLLKKVNESGSINLHNAKLAGVDPASWHVWKMIAEGRRIQVFIDGILYIDYDDLDRPYVKGSSRIGSTNSNVEFEYIQVYEPLSDGAHKLTLYSNNSDGNFSKKTLYFNVNASAKIEEQVTGKIGVPYLKSGLNITVKSATVSIAYTSVWLIVENMENKEKPFKLGTGSIILDSKNQQYEIIKVQRTSEIAQTNLYPKANREGPIFFDRMKDAGTPKKLVLNINGEKFEFTLD